MEHCDVIVIGSGAGNPALTALANSLRVGDHILERLGAKRSPAAAHAS